MQYTVRMGGTFECGGNQQSGSEDAEHPFNSIISVTYEKRGRRRSYRLVHANFSGHSTKHVRVADRRWEGNTMNNQRCLRFWLAEWLQFAADRLALWADGL